MLYVVSHASPDHAALLAVAGVLLIYLELNRPGLIVPGAFGLLALLLSVSALLPLHFNPLGLGVLGVSFGIQLLGTRRQNGWLPSLLAGVGIVAGLHFLLLPAEGSTIHFPQALAAGLLLGPGTSVLTAIARRARTNKGLDS